jgi:hypothetical protein
VRQRTMSESPNDSESAMAKDRSGANRTLATAFRASTFRPLTGLYQASKEIQLGRIHRQNIWYACYW